MGTFWSSVKDLLSYKEPKDTEHGFELLEPAGEGQAYTPPNYAQEDSAPEQEKNTASKKIRQKKKPLSMEEIKEKQQGSTDNGGDKGKKQNISRDLDENILVIKEKFNLPTNQDIIIREFDLAREKKACLLFVDGMMDKTTLNQFILPKLMDPMNFTDFDKESCPITYIERKVIPINQVSKEKDFIKITQQVLGGVTALFIDGCAECLLLETRGYEKRNISTPQSENVVRGSQEGFTENLRTNITLIRRIVKNEKLVTEIYQVGETNHNNCAVLYLEGVASPALIKEVKRRIKGINTDFIEGSGMLENLIEDNPLMLFPQVLDTERPDRAASFIMEGQVVMVVDGSPFVLAVPVTFFHLFHSSEDYMVRWQFGSFLRLIRLIGMAFALFLPGFYTALVLFHQELIPTPLLASLMQSRENVPFPIILEVLLMELSFELIREGGIRVPGLIGQTLGIIGALILGQAAVAAGLVSPILIIVVAMTGLGSFTIPNYSLSLGVRITRFIFTIFGAIAGFFGICVAGTIVGALACSMKSFGVPFLSPIAPKTKTNPDIIIRQPIYKQNMRSDYFNTQNRKREPETVRAWTEEKGGDDK